VHFLWKNYLRKQFTSERIKPKWNGDHIEYGVCTHIDSKGKPVQNYGLCPEKLKCDARQDKHVCSCGVDKYFDEETTLCCEYLNKKKMRINIR
jgi:hypothetical protein